MSQNSQNKETALKPYQYVDELIPSLVPCLLNLERIILNDSHIDPNLDRYNNLVNSWKLIRSDMRSFEPDLSLFCDEEWKWLDQVDDGLVCAHILAALATIYSLPQFKELDLHDQSVILYGLLFHDIAKRGPPEIETKDPLHPFTSAAKAILIFKRLGWIQNEQYAEEASEYIKNAFFFHEWANFMDNRKLSVIYKYLLCMTGLIETPDSNFRSYFKLTREMDKERLFIFEILTVILFHQSIDFDPQFPNFTPLKKWEILKFLSPRLLKLLMLVYLGDSGSYCLPYKRRTWDYIDRVKETLRRLQKLF